jgi:hypothetical protein
MTSRHLPPADPYRLDPDGPPDRPDRPARRAGRAALWFLLVVSMAANSVASFGDAATGLHLAFGGLTAGCAAALLVLHLRRAR